MRSRCRSVAKARFIGSLNRPFEDGQAGNARGEMDRLNRWNHFADGPTSPIFCGRVADGCGRQGDLSRFWN